MPFCSPCILCSANLFATSLLLILCYNLLKKAPNRLIAAVKKLWDMERLPVTNDDQIAEFQAEYNQAFGAGTQEDLESAKCRLIWALVHSTTRTNQQRGLDLAQAALDNDQRTQDQDRELRYFTAVALFKLGRCLDARRTLTAVLADYPEFRQAESLKSEVDERVVKDGLLGLGIAGAVAAVALGIIFGAGRKR